MKRWLKHEFIGHEIEIVSAPQKSLAGIRGVVVDETKNMLVIHVEGEDMKIQKKNLLFRILPENQVIDGNRIMFRPEDRIKKIRR
ncbi:MAG: ribonuclease P protein subunit [Thermoplasmata archaeon]|nr:ribonuclease P protein subunit [Thermoplasmata archaeon]